MHLKTVVYTLFIGAFFFLSSCNRDNLEATVPGYLVIDTFNVNYSEANRTGRGLINISDAWVYVNDDIQGVFELPARIPLTDVGEGQTITIGPGIKVNGIAATRDEYQFYQRAVFQDIDITADSVFKLTPTIDYYSTTEFPLLENFESSILAFDSIPGYGDVTIDRVRLDENDPYLERYVGYIRLNSSEPDVKIISQYYSLPGSGSPVYFEIDYRCNARYVIGLAIQPSSGSAYDYPIMWVNPTNNNGSSEPVWNKIYLDLTDQISFADEDALYFGITITATHTTSLDSSYFYFDNMKLVHS